MRDKSFPNTLSMALDAAEEKAKHDTDAKYLVASKEILATILRWCVPEFRGMEKNEIIPYIEGEPQVETVRVEPGMTNTDLQGINGINTEDIVPNEGRIFYDILFTASIPEKPEDRLYINVELMDPFSPGYPLFARGIFYLVRRISNQAGKDFSLARQEYGRISKAYSIWIVFDSPAYAADSVTRVHLFPETLHGNKYDPKGYDLMELVVVCLSRDDRSEHQLVGMLETLFSDTLTPTEKKRILSEKYDITLTEKEEERMENMGGLGEGIERRALARGEEKGIKIGEEKGIKIGEEKGIEKGQNLQRIKTVIRMNSLGAAADTIAYFLEMTVDEVKEILRKEI